MLPCETREAITSIPCLVFCAKPEEDGILYGQSYAPVGWQHNLPPHAAPEERVKFLQAELAEAVDLFGLSASRSVAS
jgi:hypothetical protein